MSGRRSVVTGGAGFIGSHLADALLARGDDVVVVDTLSDGMRANVPKRATLVEADIRNADALSRALEGADLVLHHAAVASVPRCSGDPGQAFDVNVNGTMVLAETLRRVAPEARIVLASSAAVYGTNDVPTAFEEDGPTAPASVYGATKLMAETGLLSLRRAFGFDARVVRYANVYGPRQPRYILFDMYRKVRASDGTLEVLGSGRQLRDFVYVADAVGATLAVADAPDGPHRVFNIGTGDATSVIDLTQIVAAEMGRPDLELHPTRASWLGDVDYLLLDPSRVKEFYPMPRITLRDGVRAFIEWAGSTR